MTRFAYERIARGEPMPGVIEVRARAPTGEVIDDLLLIVECALNDEFRDRVIYVPRR
jgi:hypothetical protein